MYFAIVHNQYLDILHKIRVRCTLLLEIFQELGSSAKQTIAKKSSLDPILLYTLLCPKLLCTPVHENV